MADIGAAGGPGGWLPLPRVGSRVAALSAPCFAALLDFTQGKNAAARESLQKVLRSAPDHMPSILLAGAVEPGDGPGAHIKRDIRLLHTGIRCVIICS